jgi:Xaa-Pro aminopeptidase
VQYASTNISKYVTYEEKGALPPNVIVDTLANVLHSEGLSSSCIGLEMLRTPVVFWKKLIELVPNAKFEEADATLRRLRMVKTAKEIDVISTGARLTDDALWRGYSESKIGDTELDVARRITLNTLDNGCDVVTSMLLGTGEGAYALAAPTKRKLEPNSFVRQDMNSMLGGYYVDIGRMAFVGKPNSEQLKAYQDQVDFKYRIFDYMKPGITCEQVHAFYQETAKKMGIRPFVYPYIGLGHGTGVNNDEFPKLNFGDKTVLEPGMILNVEPDTLDPDGVVLHTEDMVLVTNDGIELITKSDGHDWKELFIISS